MIIVVYVVVVDVQYICVFLCDQIGDVFEQLVLVYGFDYYVYFVVIVGLVLFYWQDVLWVGC